MTMTKAQLTTLADTLTEAQGHAAIRHVIDADPALARAALDTAIALYPVTGPDTGTYSDAEIAIHRQEGVVTGMLRALPACTEARALHFLTAQRGYGEAARTTIDAARAAPGRFAYTPDGCVWVTVRDGCWVAGDSTRAEARLADARHSGPLATRVDPDVVAANDAITWTPPAGGKEVAGRVEYTTAAAVHVIMGAPLGALTGRGYRYPIEWHRVTAHIPSTGLPPLTERTP